MPLDDGTRADIYRDGGILCRAGLCPEIQARSRGSYVIHEIPDADSMRGYRTSSTGEIPSLHTLAPLSGGKEPLDAVVDTEGRLCRPDLESESPPFHRP
jgi:hypothetical protein